MEFPESLGGGGGGWGEGGLKKNPFHWGGGDIFWNYAIGIPISQFCLFLILILLNMYLYSKCPGWDIRLQSYPTSEPCPML